jgi:hypothetical protein
LLVAPGAYPRRKHLKVLQLGLAKSSIKEGGKSFTTLATGDSASKRKKSHAVQSREERTQLGNDASGVNAHKTFFFIADAAAK